MASKQTRLVLVLAAVAACLLLLPDASVATDVDYCSEYPRPPPRPPLRLGPRQRSCRFREASQSCNCNLFLVWPAGKKDYPVKVSGVQIVPDPVEPGKPATFKISATTGIVDLVWL
jgi:hypothetical protein